TSAPAAVARRSRGDAPLGGGRGTADSGAGYLVHRPADAVLNVAHMMQHQRVGRVTVVCAHGFEDLTVVLAVLAAMPRSDSDVECGYGFRRQVGEGIHQHHQRYVAGAVGDRPMELAGCRTRVG